MVAPFLFPSQMKWKFEWQGLKPRSACLLPHHGLLVVEVDGRNYRPKSWETWLTFRSPVPAGFQNWSG